MGQKHSQHSQSGQDVAVPVTFQQIFAGSPADQRQFMLRFLTAALLADTIYASNVESQLCENQAKYPWFSCSEFQMSEPSHETYFGVFQCSSGIFLVVRGSFTDSDWDHNKDTQSENFVGGKAHRGFVRHASGLPAKTIAHAHPGQPLILAGHSLGGASAVLASTLLSSEHIDSEAFTFGQPSAFYEKPHIDSGKIYRTFFQDDPVSMVTQLTGGVAVENLFCMQDGETKTISRSNALPDRASVPDILRGEVPAKHAMRRYKDAISGLLPNDFARRPVAAPRPQEKNNYNIHIEEFRCEYRKSGNRILMSLTGEGENVQFVRVALFQNGKDLLAPLCATNAFYVTKQVAVVDGGDVTTKDVEVMRFALEFDISDVNFEGRKVVLEVSNGLCRKEHTFPAQLVNTAIIGLPGSGKSCLVKGLRAVATKQAMPEEPEAGVHRNDASLNETFCAGHECIYEIAGLNPSLDATAQEIDDHFDKYPPRVVGFTWPASGTKLDQRDGKHIGEFLGNAVPVLREHGVKIFVALTKAEATRPEFYDNLKKDMRTAFNLPDEIPIFLVNSVNGANGIPAKGVQELYDWIQDQTKDDLPLNAVIKLSTIWQRLMQKWWFRRSLDVLHVAEVVAVVAAPTVGLVAEEYTVLKTAAVAAPGVARGVWGVCSAGGRNRNRGVRGQL